MKILKLKKVIEIKSSEIPEPIKAQEFELLVSPDELTYGDIINDLASSYELDKITFMDDTVYKLIHGKDSSFLKEKHKEETDLYFLQKGLQVIGGDPCFNYIGLCQARYYSSGGNVSSEGPNNNYLLEQWKKGRPEYKNIKYSFLTLVP